MNVDTLENAFKSAFEPLIEGRASHSEALLAFCHDSGSFVADDLPYPLDKDGYADYRRFHDDGLWQALTLSVVSLAAQVHGTTGLVHGTYNLRGKPKDAGFRQRPGHFSAVCVWDDEAECWAALNIHFSPLFSQVLDACPS